MWPVTWMTSELKIEADRAKASRKHREESRFEAERLKLDKDAAKEENKGVTPKKK